MKRILTVKNRQKMVAGLRKYIKEVLSQEDYIKTFADCAREARRTQCYKGQMLTGEKVADWLRGLPLGTEYMTYNIVNMLLDMVNIKREDFDRGVYQEDSYDLDCFYWSSLGWIIYSKA